MEFICHQGLKKLPDEISVPRIITSLQPPLTEKKLRGFGDARKMECSAVIYGVFNKGRRI